MQLSAINYHVQFTENLYTVHPFFLIRICFIRISRLIFENCFKKKPEAEILKRT